MAPVTASGAGWASGIGAGGCGQPMVWAGMAEVFHPRAGLSGVLPSVNEYDRRQVNEIPGGL
jgi:hypothetical protein